MKQNLMKNFSARGHNRLEPVTITTSISRFNNGGNVSEAKDGSKHKDSCMTRHF